MLTLKSIHIGDSKLRFDLLNFLLNRWIHSHFGEIEIRYWQRRSLLTNALGQSLHQQKLIGDGQLRDISLNSFERRYSHIPLHSAISDHTRVSATEVYHTT